MSSICSENDNKYSAAAQLELLMQTRAKCHLWPLGIGVFTENPKEEDMHLE